MADLVWRKSSKCESSGCVLVSFRDGMYYLCQSDNPEVALAFTQSEWEAFIGGVVAGDFDQF